eukprot:m.134009 g.134009  ORF g.134009 m.134009 type:complete len:216 (+) comp15814_c0_seq1:182-829(+)
MRVFRHLVHNVDHRPGFRSHVSFRHLLRAELFIVLLAAAYLYRSAAEERVAAWLLRLHRYPPFPEYHDLMWPLVWNAASQSIGWTFMWLLLGFLPKMPSIQHKEELLTTEAVEGDLKQAQGCSHQCSQQKHLDKQQQQEEEQERGEEMNKKGKEEQQEKKKQNTERLRGQEYVASPLFGQNTFHLLILHSLSIFQIKRVGEGIQIKQMEVRWGVL